MIKNYWTYINEQFKVGQKLTHKKNPQFGVGIVSKINNDVVFIDFEHGKGFPSYPEPMSWTTTKDNFEHYNVVYSEEELKRLKKLRLKYKDIDPYGEEIWESYGKELNPDKFVIQDVIDVFDGDMDKVIKWMTDQLKNEEVLIYCKESDGHDRLYGDMNIVINKFIERNDGGGIIYFISKKGETRGLLATDIISKRICSELDPYGEEDWANEGVEYIKETLKEIPPTMSPTLEIRYEDILEEDINAIEYLNKNLTGWIKFTTPELERYIIHVVKYEPGLDWPIIRNINIYYNSHISSNVLTSSDSILQYNLNIGLNDSFIKYEEREPLIIKNELDPYGEEDWHEYIQT